ncbi:response regulator [Neolewinella antarctica]|uniref:histidine kinase n=1 Tax=Neolewinella antarctica TaxID=442734 RepID=A0ABX0XBX3_9BACT|nr:response regulator [Neolewinella antarctica]NJC26697.1 signal transduction histidine kinase/DNA-binding response OmpR family regulator [Neolewinella antarctica]
MNYRVMRLLCLLISVLGCAAVTARATPEIVLLTSETLRHLHAQIFSKQVHFVDYGGQYSLAGIGDGSTIDWRKNDFTTELPDGNYYLWTKTVFKNTGTRARTDYLIFTCCSQDAAVAILRDGRVDALLHGEALRGLMGEPNAAPLHLRPGEQVTVIYRARVEKRLSLYQASSIYVRDANQLSKLAIIRYRNGYFAIGFLACLLVFSLIIYLLFREKEVGFLALLLLGFGGSFFYHGELTGIFPQYDALRKVGLNAVNLASTLTVTGMTGFLYYYLDLPKRFGRFSRWYLALTGVTIGVGVLFMLNALETDPLFYLANFVTAVWIVATLGLVGIVAWNGGRLERVLLGSTVLLAFASLFFIVSVVMDYESDSFRKLFGVSTLAFTSLLFYGVYDKVSMVSSEARQLKSQYAFRSRFFANITHEFRTPLTLILGPIRQLLDRSQSHEDKALLDIAHRNAQRQLQLVNQILDLSESTTTGLRLNPEVLDVVPLLRRLTYTYASLADQHGIDLRFVTELTELPLRADREKLETIMYNLLTNAFKFTFNGGEITVRLALQRDTALISVRDTGGGIAPDAAEKVFDRYYSDGRKGREGTVGNGIGLALTKELVLLHGGAIGVTSVPNVETVFTVSLPYVPGVLVCTTAPASAPSALLTTSIYSPNDEETGEASNTEKPLILIVEDNADMRSYIRMGLAGSYRTALAKDGREGVAQARKLMPDLVVSDVMMPEMDGFELCEDLKTSITTSHIPVILLTARSAGRDRIQGLDTGADDYLTKPFEVPELRARVRNLVQSRQLLRQRFASAVTLKPEEVAATSIDQEFLRAAIQAVEDHMEDVDFGIDRLAQELNVSRPNLNRKFRALLNQSSNQFLRGIRLQRAADLLNKTQDTVAAITDAVGFRSVSYFVKSFRDEFGTTPGKYRKAAGADVEAK